MFLLLTHTQSHSHQWWQATIQGTGTDIRSIFGGGFSVLLKLKCELEELGIEPQTLRFVDHVLHLLSHNRPQPKMGKKML